LQLYEDIVQNLCSLEQNEGTAYRVLHQLAAIDSMLGRMERSVRSMQATSTRARRCLDLLEYVVGLFRSSVDEIRQFASDSQPQHARKAETLARQACDLGLRLLSALQRREETSINPAPTVQGRHLLFSDAAETLRLGLFATLISTDRGGLNPIRRGRSRAVNPDGSQSHSSGPYSRSTLYVVSRCAGTKPAPRIKLSTLFTVIENSTPVA
jgi:hypothetical protein